MAKQNIIALRPSYWASVSGGKDSLYMLKLILDHPEKYPLTGVVHFELEIDYPFIKDVIDYMEAECKKAGVRFVRIKPGESYYELLEKYGFPSRRVRWCNSKYILDAERQLRSFLHSQGYDLISYVGYCLDEIKRYEKRNNRRERYPLVEEGIEESTILEWAKTVPLFNRFYEFNRRCGCMYCPLASRAELAYLAHFYPDNYKFMIDAADKTEKKLTEKFGKPFGVFRGDGTLVTYIDKTIQEKYLPRLRARIAEEDALET